MLIPLSQTTALLAVCFSFGAAAIHFAVTSEHLAEDALFGMLFASLAWFQLGWGAAYAHRPQRRLAAVAIAVNLGAAAVWLLSRTVGLPLRPEAGGIEPVGTLDLLATTFELALVGLLALQFTQASERASLRLSRPQTTAIVGTTALMIAVISTAAFASTGSHTHGSGTDHEHGAHATPSPGGVSIGSPTPRASTSPAAAGSQGPSPSLASASSSPEGTIAFGARMGIGGQLEEPTSTFRIGATAVWIVRLNERPPATGLRFVVLEARPDGRLLEHWNQEIRIADPAANQIVGMANLSAYGHGGAGSYLLRYLVGDEILAEGMFTLVP